MDREKAVSTFEKIISVCKEDGCDFVDLSFEDAERILALLKEQEPAKVRHLHNAKVTVYEEIVFTDECENCSGYLLKHWKACPICGKPVETEYTRIVGFYTPVKTWSKERTNEYKMRRWEGINSTAEKIV